MIIKAFTIDEKSRLAAIDSEDLSQEWLIDEIPRWIDVEAAEADALSDFLSPLCIPQPIIESCLKPSDEPELVHYENVTYIEFPLILKNQDYKLMYVSMLFLPTTLITIHMGTVSTISTLEARLSTESLFRSSDISGLLYQIFVHLIKLTYRFFRDVRAEINHLSKAIIEKSDRVELEDVLNMARSIDLFITVTEDQNYCIENILASESKSVGLGNEHQNFRELNRSLQSAIRIINRYDGRVTELLQFYMLTLQDKTNNRLRVLTVISAVFLPLTLIAGIYGMNFRHMPELAGPYSYYIVLSLMFVIALGMLFFFYRRGWFD